MYLYITVYLRFYRFGNNWSIRAKVQHIFCVYPLATQPLSCWRVKESFEHI